MTALVLDHLWQSTVFTLCAALLTLALRANAARLRYGIWFIASLKYLVPFALLAAAGRVIAPAAAPGLQLSAETFDVMQDAALPFASSAAALPSPGWTFDAGTAAAGVWMLGTGAVLLLWWIRWLRMLAVQRGARPLSPPADFPAPVMVSPTTLEPGLLGIFRPILLLPKGIEGHLSAAEMDAIFQHELCHLRRRDNLTAAIHMLAQAVFWFHPLVWWLGTRLIAERERACDEAVLAAGGDPETYAEGILKVCKFYLQSRLICASGVSGADLRKRVEEIMLNRVIAKLAPAKKLLLGAAAALAVTAPILAGCMAARQTAPASTSRIPPVPDGSIVLPRTAASPGTEASLRRFIASMQKGRPNYEEMTEPLASTLRAQASVNIPMLQSLGAMKALTFRQVMPDGTDIYEGDFENGRAQFAIGPLTPDGKVLRRSWSIMPTPAEQAAARQRVINGMKDPAREALLRREIAAEQSGELDESITTPLLAAAMRQQWPGIVEVNRRLGAFKTLTFDRVDRQGADVYTAVYEHGRRTYLVGPLSDDGKLRGLLAQRASVDGEQAALAVRLAAGTPDPERAALLRRVIAGIEAGTPDEGAMTPQLLASAKSQWPGVQERTRQLGALRTLTFINVDAAGNDIYTADFEHGRVAYTVGAPTADHKLQGLGGFPCAMLNSTSIRLGCNLFLSRTTPAPQDPAQQLPRWAAGGAGNPPPASPPREVVAAVINQGGGTVAMTAHFAADGAVQVAVDHSTAPPALEEFCKGLITTPKWAAGTVNGAPQPMSVSYRCATTPTDAPAR